MISCLQPPNTLPCSLFPVSLMGSSASSSSFLGNHSKDLSFGTEKDFRSCRGREGGGRGRVVGKRRGGVVCGGWLLPVDPWAPTIDSESIASQLFAFSLFPYLGFLYFITKSKSAPKLTLFGFYFLLAFVGATIPAGIYAKVHYGTSLANVDWLHGGAESLLTLTNLFIVLGLRQALRKASDTEKTTSNPASIIKEEKSSST